MRELYKMLNFKELGDDRGNLVVIEGNQDIPFEIKRIFYIFGSDSTVVRGKHANKKSEFVLVNVAGSSKVMITDGDKKEIIVLDKPMEAVYLPKMIWKEMYDFSNDSILLVIASTHYDGKEYIRDYKEYLKIMENYDG